MNVFSSGNYGHNTSTSSSVVASHSCANCPTYKEALNYLNAGTYWDNGADIAGTTTPSYTLPGGATVYHTGLWVKKGAYTETYTGGSTSFSTQPVTAAIRNGGAYFFLPAGGVYYTYDQWNTTLTGKGSFGCYWLSEVKDADHGYSLRFESNYANVVSDTRVQGARVWKKEPYLHSKREFGYGSFYAWLS
jgi:hypothetical protein